MLVDLQGFRPLISSCAFALILLKFRELSATRPSNQHSKSARMWNGRACVADTCAALPLTINTHVTEELLCLLLLCVNRERQQHVVVRFRALVLDSVLHT